MSAGVIDELEALGPLGRELGRRARGDGLATIWRAQVREARRVVVRKGRPEDTSHTSSSGHGIQVFTDDGRTALASRDDFDPEAALELLAAAAGTARMSASLGAHPAPFPALDPVEARAIPDTASAFDRVDLARVTSRLAEIEREVAAHVEGLNLRISFLADLDAWRVQRSDGGDVTFAMPRCVLRLDATCAGPEGTHSVGAALSSPDPNLPWDDAGAGLFMRRAILAARLARELPDAPSYPSGSYPVVIDYALAKGLAHEAFGHAAEADGYRSSVLAADGRFRRGERVGPPHVSIVDEPVAGDHAWQPFSANGVRRERVVVVDHGRLSDGLSDPWSAEVGGVRLSGAGRASSFRVAPLPRMSNIRIEVDDPCPAPGSFEDYGPAEVLELLGSAGILGRHPRVVFLSGYSGGQVNTATGDFVFNCKAIYELSGGGVRLYKPAIFSGSMFGALGAIREAFGPLLLDALGTCGKWGQSVPSSGGSHYFLFLEPDPTVRLGGKG
jgi:TldD protein